MKSNASTIARPAANDKPVHHTLTGAIKTIEATKHQLVLQGGEVFHLAKTIDLKPFKAGEKVTVSYEKKGAEMFASSLQPAK